MRNVRIPLVLLLGIGAFWAVTRPLEVAATNGGSRGSETIAMEDDCDTNDPTWDNADGTEGCAKRKGTVTRAEFTLFSVWTPPTATTPPGPPAGTPLARAVIGHPSWRNSPGYLVVETDDRLKVENKGGRGHTFTPVQEFGGGFVPPLSFGLTTAPECAAIATDPTQVIAPGRRATVSGLTPGDHKFMCCIHPWMRTLVKVTENDDHGHHKN